MSTTLVHIGVRASDLETTIRFWRDGLGLPVFSQMENCYDLSDGYHNFRVFQHSGPARPAHVSGMLDYLHIGVQVDDLEETARRSKLTARCASISGASPSAAGRRRSQQSQLRRRLGGLRRRECDYV